MVAKRSLRALALLLALPSAALALGLGDIRLLSPLNAPLDAEVDLVDVAPDEANTVQAQLASRETFARYGLDWPAYLAGVQVRTVRAPDGRQMLKLRSTEAISEPFITLLVRSEEHTSELQSQSNLVCRLLLEKKISPERIVAAGHRPETVARVIQLVDRSEYKRRQAPPGVKITPRAFGRDRRMPIVNRYSPNG